MLRYLLVKIILLHLRKHLCHDELLLLKLLLLLLYLNLLLIEQNLLLLLHLHGLVLEHKGRGHKVVVANRSIVLGITFLEFLNKLCHLEIHI